MKKLNGPDLGMAQELDNYGYAFASRAMSRCLQEEIRKNFEQEKKNA